MGDGPSSLRNSPRIVAIVCQYTSHTSRKKTYPKSENEHKHRNGGIDGGDGDIELSGKYRQSGQVDVAGERAEEAGDGDDGEDEAFAGRRECGVGGRGGFGGGFGGFKIGSRGGFYFGCCHLGFGR